LAWRIEYTDTARRALRKLDARTARQILDYMDDRVAARGDPRTSGKILTGPALGSFWRYRVGDYRIICDIQDTVLRVLVVGIGHRRELYR
jgi:mRNA interferase RelE/StbE